LHGNSRVELRQPYARRKFLPADSRVSALHIHYMGRPQILWPVRKKLCKKSCRLESHADTLANQRMGLCGGVPYPGNSRSASRMETRPEGSDRMP
jgi:hypothetical protein